MFRRLCKYKEETASQLEKKLHDRQVALENSLWTGFGQNGLWALYYALVLISFAYAVAVLYLVPLAVCEAVLTYRGNPQARASCIDLLPAEFTQSEPSTKLAIAAAVAAVLICGLAHAVEAFIAGSSVASC